MLHCDDDELSLVALGEAPTPEDETHLHECPRCNSRLDQMTAVVASARSITDADRPEMPPVEIWDSITRELGVQDTGNVTSITAAPSRRGSRTWLLAGAAAIVGVLLGGIVTAGLQDTTSSPELLASAALDPIADSGFTGTAAVEQRPDGAVVLTVSVPDLPAVPDGYYEVWMASPDTTTMVAIGTLSPGQNGTFALPAGMEVGSFPVVDISVEHFDGDAGHSAVSVVRGQLQA